MPVGSVILTISDSQKRKKKIMRYRSKGVKSTDNKAISFRFRHHIKGYLQQIKKLNKMFASQIVLGKKEYTCKGWTALFSMVCLCNWMVLLEYKPQVRTWGWPDRQASDLIR